MRNETTYKLSNYEEIFVNMAKNYASVYSEHSFRLYFDGHEYSLIGNSSNKTIAVEFINSRRVFERIFQEGSIGLGESYCDGNIQVVDRDYKYFLLNTNKIPLIFS